MPDVPSQPRNVVGDIPYTQMKVLQPSIPILITCKPRKLHDLPAQLIPLTTMQFTLPTLAALAVLAQTAFASPVTTGLTDVGKTLPVVDITKAIVQTNKTRSGGRKNRIHADFGGLPPPPGTFPATLLLCPTANCVSCIPLDMSTLPHNVCMAQSFNITSIAVDQPSDAGFPFGIFFGPAGCLDFSQLPAVNQCFNLASGNGTAPTTDIALN
ncbi:hypothetical protein C8Q77DRAFT_306023 [Trametes polyzona]|nr:hypothetical protein C8Q77DRAFT_306023 [Trametes polyzona]